MICPHCSVAEISPLTGVCDLCGYNSAAPSSIAVDHPDALDELARRELAHEFRFDAILGQGAESIVYLARESNGDRHVVLKVLARQPGHPDADERFRATLAGLTALDHPHLVELFRYGITDSLFWYSAEHVRSRSLRDLLRAGPLDVRSTIRIASQVASMLEHGHRRGIVHGAVKPENILVDAEGWARVCDPSVSAALAREKNPEDLIPQGDQRGLAMVIYECLTGKPLTSDGVLDLPPAAAHLAQPLRRASHATAFSRFPSVLDLVAAMETGVSPLLSSQHSPSRSSSSRLAMIPDWKPPANPQRMRPVLIGAAVFGVVAVLALLAPRVLQLTRSNEWESMPQVISAPRPVVRADTAVADSAPRPARDVERAASRRRPRRADAPVAPDPTPPPAAAPRPAAPAAAAPEPPAASGEQGRLFVNSTPWGVVYLDGQLIGNTPKANLAVSAGSHVLRVAREGYEPFERTIRVGAGEVVRVTNIVLVERP